MWELRGLEATGLGAVAVYWIGILPLERKGKE